jgi:hypothetical protein
MTRYQRGATIVRSIYNKLLNANIKNEHNVAPINELRIFTILLSISRKPLSRIVTALQWMILVSEYLLHIAHRYLHCKVSPKALSAFVDKIPDVMHATKIIKNWPILLEKREPQTVPMIMEPTVAAISPLSVTPPECPLIIVLPVKIDLGVDSLSNPTSVATVSAKANASEPA